VNNPYIIIIFIFIIGFVVVWWFCYSFLVLFFPSRQNGLGGTKSWAGKKE
jgi:hypothetical protein